MDTIRTILKEKGSTVHSVAPAATVFEAVQAMCANKVGAVLVCTADQPLGIFTERDLMTRVILSHRDPATTRVEEVMTREVVCVDPDTRAEEAMAIITDRRCRHLPVVEGARVAGMVSIGDLVRWTNRTKEFHIRMLTDYICGKYPG